MLEIITNIRKVPWLRSRITTSMIETDSYRTTTPIIIKNNGKTFLIAKHIDRGNIEELKKNTIIPKDWQVLYPFRQLLAHVSICFFQPRRFYPQFFVSVCLFLFFLPRVVSDPIAYSQI